MKDKITAGSMYRDMDEEYYSDQEHKTMEYNERYYQKCLVREMKRKDQEEEKEYVECLIKLSDYRRRSLSSDTEYCFYLIVSWFITLVNCLAALIFLQVAPPLLFICLVFFLLHWSIYKRGRSKRYAFLFWNSVTNPYVVLYFDEDGNKISNKEVL